MKNNKANIANIINKFNQNIFFIIILTIIFKINIISSMNNKIINFIPQLPKNYNPNNELFMYYSNATDKTLEMKINKTTFQLNQMGLQIFEISPEIQFKVNIKEDISFEFNSTNTQFGTNFFDLYNITYNNQVLKKGIDYSKNNSLSIKDSYSHEASFFYNSTFEYSAYCQLKTFESSLDGQWMSVNLNIIKQFRGISFGVDTSKFGVYHIQPIYDSSNVTSSFRLIDIYESYMRNTKSETLINSVLISDIHIIDEYYEKSSYLVLISSNEKRVIYLKIIMNEKNELVSLIRTFDFKYMEILNGSVDIYSVGMIEGYFLIGASRGLFVLKPLERAFFEDLSKEDIDYYNNYPFAKDKFFQMNLVNQYTQFRNEDGSFIPLIPIKTISLKTTIYIACRNYGIVLLIKNKDNESFQYDFSRKYLYQLPYINSLDLVFNPITFIPFIGASSKEKGEFFIELILEYEEHPKINKVFRLIDPRFDKIQTFTIELIYNNVKTVDQYFTYLYNEYNGSLIVIRRGLINIVPYKTVVISTKSLTDNIKYLKFEKEDAQLKYDMSPKSILFSIYNNSTGLNNLGILYDKSLVNQTNNLILFNDYSPKNDHLICNFTHPGKYHILLIKNGEACETSINLNYAYTYCTFLQKVIVETIGPDMTDLTRMGIILGSVLGALFLLFILFFIVKTQCCTEFKFFNGSKPVPSREELYKEYPLKDSKDTNALDIMKNQYNDRYDKFIDKDNEVIGKNSLKKSEFENNYIDPKIDKEKKM